jgi:xanthine/uracil permease
MTGADLDHVMGRAIAADGVATAVASSVGGSPTTTYAENIGVMAATRVYSTAAYVVAALIAILFGLSPKFGALVASTPGGVLGGITVVLYGMIGLLGAKIWKENGVDFANPINLVPVAAGIVLGIGNTSLKIPDLRAGRHRPGHHRDDRGIPPGPRLRPRSGEPSHGATIDR